MYDSKKDTLNYIVNVRKYVRGLLKNSKQV